MIEFQYVIVVAAFAGMLVFLILILILQRFLQPKIRTKDVISDIEETGENLQNGISTQNCVFSWNEYPSLVTDVVENGWSRFAFTTFVSSPSVESSRFVSGVASDQENGVYYSWEICEGSEDYMQKIRLNPGLKKITTNLNPVSVIRTGLPLPGPILGNPCFPEEAYVEITIFEDIHDHEENEDTSEKCEKIKLIQEDFNAKIDSGSFSEEMKFVGKWNEKNEVILVCIGLTGGGPLQLKFPGSFPGSIGFNSSGSVYLDGTKLAPESEYAEWGRPENIIGCGYNPHLKKVFFTVDSQLVHQIHCNTEEYGFPLYPTIAANTDITILVNFGQSPFKYLPANLQRNPNPCFIRPHINSPSLGFEDSKELFSIGRLDSLRSMTRSNNITVNGIRSIDFDRESEGDLFEIVLDRTRSSSFMTSYQ